MHSGATAAHRAPPSSSRLKDVKVDPLEAVGLPSKGDDRLLDPKIQEEYYDRLRTRYCQLAGVRAENQSLEDAFAWLSLDHDKQRPPLIVDGQTEPSNAQRTHMKASDERELTTLLAAMRKLREAIVASARTDNFALDVYIFIIRATILQGHMESYHPALLHLLRKILPATDRSDQAELRQTFMEYYILDLACRQNDLGGAFHLYLTSRIRSISVDTMLKALARGNWYLYWRQCRKMDMFQRKLVQWSDERMRVHALDCIGASYLSVTRSYIEGVSRHEWTAEVSAERKPGWLLNGDTVVIRQIKKK